MDGITKQRLHGFGPKGGGVQIDQGLQVSDLVCQANLWLSGSGFQLSRQTVTDPHFGLMVTHDTLDHVRTAVETDHMQHRCHRAEDPFPPVLTIHTAAGFIAMDDCALANLLLYGFRLLARFLTSSL